MVLIPMNAPGQLVYDTGRNQWDPGGDVWPGMRVFMEEWKPKKHHRHRNKARPWDTQLLWTNESKSDPFTKGLQSRRS